MFFSNLIYLLYIKKIVDGADLETDKEKNKSVLIKELERKKSLVLKRSSVRSTDALDCGKREVCPICGFRARVTQKLQIL